MRPMRLQWHCAMRKSRESAIAWIFRVAKVSLLLRPPARRAQPVLLFHAGGDSLCACRRLLVFALIALAVCPVLVAGPAGLATITFRKVFKSSYPEFVEIKVDESGSGTYDIRQLSDDPSPQPMKVDPAIARKIFDLAGKLHNFDGIDLEMHRRIANLGEKTFSYQNGSEMHSVNFNYTTDRFAGQLLDIFDGLSRQLTDVSDLIRTMRYDRLGVNDVLLQIEKDYDHKLLPQPEALLPSLDKLAADSHYLDIARERARNLASRIRSQH
jgi:hypothetical protein